MTFDIVIPSSMQEDVIHKLSLMASLSMSSRSSVGRAPPPGVREVMGLIPIADSDFFFAPQSCHVNYFIFITFITFIIGEFR